MEASLAPPHSPDEKASLAGPQRAGRGHQDATGSNFKPNLVGPFSFVQEAPFLAWNAEEGSGGITLDNFLENQLSKLTSASLQNEIFRNSL